MKRLLLLLAPILSACTAQALAPDEVHVFRSWGELDSAGCGGPLALDGDDQDFDSIGLGVTWYLGHEDDRAERALERMVALMEARSQGLEFQVPVRVNVVPEPMLEGAVPPETSALEAPSVPKCTSPRESPSPQAPLQEEPTGKKSTKEDLQGEILSLLVLILGALLTYWGRDTIPGVRGATRTLRERRSRRGPPGGP